MAIQRLQDRVPYLQILQPNLESIIRESSNVETPKTRMLEPDNHFRQPSPPPIMAHRASVESGVPTSPRIGTSYSVFIFWSNPRPQWGPPMQVGSYTYQHV